MSVETAKPAQDVHAVHHAAPRRAVGALAMLGVALIHTLDLPSKLHETPYLGVGYIGVIIASIVIAEALLRKDRQITWIAAGGLSVAVVIGYVISRTTGMPSATGDIGNWLEPLGVASLFVEGTVILLSAASLLERRKPGSAA